MSTKEKFITLRANLGYEAHQVGDIVEYKRNEILGLIGTTFGEHKPKRAPAKPKAATKKEPDNLNKMDDGSGDLNKAGE